MAKRDARSFAKSERPRGKRDRLVNFKVTEDELERIRDNAERDYGGSVSAMLRARGLDDGPREARFVEVHVPEAGEAAAQINAMRLELADEGRNLAAILPLAVCVALGSTGELGRAPVDYSRQVVG